MEGKTIYKFELNIGNTLIQVPKNAQILSVQVQYEVPCIWLLVDPDEEMKEARTIEVFGTGHTIYNSDELIYIATFQLSGGSFIGHAFERKIK